MSDKKQLAPEPSMDDILASIRRILAEDNHVVTRAPPRARGASDVLDLTEALNDDGSVRHIAAAMPVTPEPPPVSHDGRTEPVAPGLGAAEREPAAEPDPEPRLVSEAASRAVAASFAQLAGLPRGEALDHAIDDIVRETLRPMLQAWLDENLPGLVERLVKAEIARVVGGIRPAAP